MTKTPDMLEEKKTRKRGAKAGKTCLTKISNFSPSDKSKKKKKIMVHKMREIHAAKWNFLRTGITSVRDARKTEKRKRVPVYLRQRGITFIRPTINSGGIVRRKNIGISSKVKPPYKKNKQQHGPLRRAVQTHIRQHCSRYTINS